MKFAKVKETTNLDSRFIQAAMSASLLEKEEEISLAKAWRENKDAKALDKLTTAHMRLVIAMALRFKNYGLPVADMIQEGCVGMMEAAARFEAGRDVRFSTYASWWIRASIQDYILRNWSIVRGGTSSAQKALFFNLRRLRAQLSKTGDDSLSDDTREEIAESLGVSRSDVAMMEARMAAPDTSLNVAVGETESGMVIERMDFLVDSAPLPDELAEQSIDEARRASWLKKALGVLNERELSIINARRLNDEQETLENLGHRLGISKERVRQIENRAMEKLHRVLSGHMSGPVAA
ncbi:MAG: RNA polymerase factor sigma-32 [Methylobacteriaceae bacterium]|jgi:RNA polymerase sigma-32 factor|nr:RNA polymerase factor sigma-32 [Methylobacteriaceae bacterium]